MLHIIYSLKICYLQFPDNLDQLQRLSFNYMHAYSTARTPLCSPALEIIWASVSNL